MPLERMDDKAKESEIMRADGLHDCKISRATMQNVCRIMVMVVDISSLQLTCAREELVNRWESLGK